MARWLLPGWLVGTISCALLAFVLFFVVRPAYYRWFRYRVTDGNFRMRIDGISEGNVRLRFDQAPAHILIVDRSSFGAVPLQIGFPVEATIRVKGDRYIGCYAIELRSVGGQTFRPRVNDAVTYLIEGNVPPGHSPLDKLICGGDCADAK